MLTYSPALRGGGICRKRSSFRKFIETGNTMPVIVSNIRLPLESDDEEAAIAALHKLGLTNNNADKTYIVKVSPDLRHRANPALVYTVGIELRNAEAERRAVANAASHSVTLREHTVFSPVRGAEVMSGRPVIAGFGPAGMFAGLLLSHMGYRPIIIERGRDVDSRTADVAGFWRSGVLDTESNVQFGEGGAGTFSDGKLMTRINDPLCDMVLDQFVRHGAPESVKRVAKPHIGTDKLRLIVKSIREDIIDHGGEVRFCTKLCGIRAASGKLNAVKITSPGCGEELIETQALILAIGHSARDTFTMLADYGFLMVPKPFSVGVRIEHLQSDIDRALYGSLAGHPKLPRGEYQLSLREGGRAVYTFCMCPGGTVVAAASESGGVVTNGMSDSSRSGRNANSALAVSVDAFSTPLGGVDFQRSLERTAYGAGNGSYKAPFTTVGDFLGGGVSGHTGRVEPTYPAGVTQADLSKILPLYVTEMLKTGIRAFDKRLHGFADPDALLTGVETRTSSPVRIERDGNRMAVGFQGVYPAGEGAGYAGGIVSAAVDGLHTAAAVIERFAPGE